VLQTDDGQIHIGTWGSGIFSYDRQFNPLPDKYSSIGKLFQQSMNWCITKASNGDIWSGIQQGIVYHQKAGTKRGKILKPAAINGSTVRQIEEDKDGNIWLGTQRGSLVKYEGDSFRVVQQFEAIISRIYVDKRNKVWVCTDVNGIFRIDPGTGSILNHYTTKGNEINRGIMGAGVSDVIQYDDSTYVIASGGLNFLNINTGKLEYINVESGLGAPDVANLVVDKDGFIWMTSSLGILSYHPVKHRLSLYDATDGIHSYSFNVASSGILKDGRIIYGTTHDFIIFDPKKVTAPELKAAKVYITGIDVMNRSLGMDSVMKLNRLDLQHYEHSLAIDLSTLTYQNSYKIYYKMEGLSDSWTLAPPNNQVLFTYLIPGNYTFQTACRDGNGNYIDITSINIYIRSPFYKTWWFYALLLLAAGLLFYWLDRERMRRKEIIPKMRNDISENLHQEINLALSNINILSEIAKMKADKEPEKSKEFIEQIRTKSHNMMIAMDDMLWSINPENDSMQKTIERMQEYIDALNIRHDAFIEILVDKKVNALELNMRARYDLIHFFKEYMTGLVNSGAEKCRVHLSFEKQQLLFTIEIDNSTCDPSKLNNLLQRQDLAQRLDLIHGKMTAQKLNSNTVIMLYLPIE
jgi:streptogramin lyase